MSEPPLLDYIAEKGLEEVCSYQIYEYLIKLMNN